MKTKFHQNRRHQGVTTFGCIVGMLITFAGGFYLGLNPQLIPFKVSMGGKFDLPTVTPRMSHPTTAPSNSGHLPQTQPSVPN